MTFRTALVKSAPLCRSALADFGACISELESGGRAPRAAKVGTWRR